jgi:hypothetical protein
MAGGQFVSAFMDAMAAIVADPNLSVSANYQQPGAGDGVGVAVRVLRSSPDETFDALGTTLVRPTDVLLAAATDVPSPRLRSPRSWRWCSPDYHTVAPEGAAAVAAPPCRCD